MAIEIQPYSAERVAAVKAFNQRLRDGGEMLFRLPERPVSAWLPPGNGEGLFEEYFLANDGAAVRGGYVLKHQPYWINGTVAPTGCPYSPISEGVVNPQFGRVGLQLILHALKKQPVLYGLGMGGSQNAFPQVLKALGWTLCDLPFFFRVVRPANFLRSFAYAERFPGGKAATRVLAATGVGWLGVTLVNAVRTRAPRNVKDVSWTLVSEFGQEVNPIWQAAHTNYSLTAVRDHAALARLYPRDAAKFLRLVVSRAGAPVGWAVALDTPMREHKFFGNARLGSVIDCFALPGAEWDVVHAVTRVLEERVDVIVTNQAHERWCRAFTRAGWMSGPSNFAFASAPELTARISPLDQHRPRLHMTRSDGEGPTHL
jgi:hypothetical protein